MTTIESSTGTTEPDAPAATARTGRNRLRGSIVRGTKSARSHIGAITVGAVTVAAVSTAGVVYFTEYRPDQQTDDAAARSAVSAASDGAVAILSYSPDTLQQDFDAAKKHLTGDFLSYYGQFTQQVVAPAAQQKSVKTSAAVVRSAVSQLHPDSAVVLLFINQTTTSTDKPDPSMTSSSVTVKLDKVDGEWRISSFDPV